MGQLQNDNIFFEVQQSVCEILNESPEISAIDFIPSNNKDLETEISKALRSQGICGIVLVNEAEFQGFESGLNTAWQVNELVVQVIENPIVNRASNNTKFIGTCEDIGAKVSQVLGGADYGHWSEFNLKKIEIGEDSGLLTAKVTFQCLVTTNISGYVPPEHPEHRIPFATKEWVNENFASLSVVYSKTQIDEIVDNILLDVGDEIIKTREAIPTKTSELINDSGFITEHQSLDEYAKTTYVDAKDNEIKGDIEDISEAIGDIQEVIPQQATSENQLADKDFVNSSIATNTATFRGTFTTLEELEAQTATNNDYAFWNTTDSEGNRLYKRYKYNGTQWVYEYDLQNSSFTSNQWLAINSGITKEIVDNRVIASTINKGFAESAEYAMNSDVAEYAVEAENANTANTATYAPNYTPLSTFNATLGDLSSIIRGI